MPIIQVEILEGRTLDQKRDLVKRLTEAMVVALGIKPEAVRIVLREMKHEHFARSGVLMLDEKR